MVASDRRWCITETIDPRHATWHYPRREIHLSIAGLFVRRSDMSNATVMKKKPTKKPAKNRGTDSPRTMVYIDDIQPFKDRSEHGETWEEICIYGDELFGHIPEGMVLVHNHIRPEGFPDVPLGLDGFRAWLEPHGQGGLVACQCGWAPKVGKHYRCKGVGYAGRND